MSPRYFARLVDARAPLNDLVIASTTGAWSQLTAGDLEIASNNQRLRLKSGRSFAPPDFVKNGDAHMPVVENSSLEIMGDEMKVDTDMAAPPRVDGTFAGARRYRPGKVARRGELAGGAGPGRSGKTARKAAAKATVAPRLSQ